MRANLIIETREITFRDLTRTEEAGILSILNQYPSLTFETSEEDNEHKLIVYSPKLIYLFAFLSYSEIPVYIIE